MYTCIYNDCHYFLKCRDRHWKKKSKRKVTKIVSGYLLWGKLQVTLFSRLFKSSPKCLHRGFYYHIRKSFLRLLAFLFVWSISYIQCLPSLLPILPHPHPYTPQQLTHLRPAVGPPIDDLRRSVEWAPAKGLQELVLLVQVGKPEVSNLQREARRREAG